MRKQHFKLKTGSNKIQPKGHLCMMTQTSINSTKSANITATKKHNKNPGYLHFYFIR